LFVVVIALLFSTWIYEEPFQAHEEPEEDAPEADRAVASEGEIFNFAYFGKMRLTYTVGTLEVASSAGTRMRV